MCTAGHAGRVLMHACTHATVKLIHATIYDTEGRHRAIAWMSSDPHCLCLPSTSNVRSLTDGRIYNGLADPANVRRFAMINFIIIDNNEKLLTRSTIRYFCGLQ